MKAGISRFIYGPLRPGIQFFNSKQYGDEQDRHHQARSRPRFEQPPDGIAPPAARQVMHHQNRHASERNGKPENVGKQIRLERLLRGFRITHAEKRAKQESESSREHRASLRAANPRLEFFQRVHYGCPANFARSFSGTSCSVAFWLSCSTRMYAAMRQRSSGSTRDA